MSTSPSPSTYAGFARHRRRRRTTPATVFSGTILRLRPFVELMEDRTLLSTFNVTNIGDSGPGSLRQAILDSNAATGATNTIDFAIQASGVQTIAPALPCPQSPTQWSSTAPRNRATPVNRSSPSPARGSGTPTR